MRKLKISYYQSRFDKGKDLHIKEVTWDELVHRLSTFKVTNETFEEYQQMETLDRLKTKDVGYFVGGEFDPPRRKTFNLQSRSVLTLDLDHLESWDVDEVMETYGKKYTFFAHSSHSHSEESPRLRLVFPLTRDVTPEEYEPLARRVASMLEMDMFDDSTYQYSRIMFWPSRSSDGEHLTITCSDDASWIDPDKILGLYEDWQDFGEWPVSSREGRVRVSAAKAEDPFTKPGLIGAFNRAYSIPEAIEAFGLPYVESGQGDDRYTYTDGTSADGAIYYPDDGHLYSHHDSDPAKGNQNAWDLVRLHKFGHLDDAENEDIPMSKRPSMQEMALLVGNNADVVAEMATAEGFDDLGDLEVEGEDGTKQKIKRSELSFDAIREYIATCTTNSQKGGRLTMEEVKDVILRVAAAGPEIEESERDVIAATLKDVYPYDGVTKGGIVKDIKSKSKSLKARASDGTDEIKDIQVEFIRNFLDEFYAGGVHLRRTGKQFWTYTGTHWIRQDEEFISGQLAQSLVQLRIDATSRKENKALAAAVGENQTSAIHASLWRMFKDMTTENTGGGVDPMGMLRTGLPAAINCANGTIVFREDGKHRLRDSDPLDLFTSVIDVTYDKSATCPTWDKFCRDAFSNSDNPKDMQRHLEELMGYILNQSRQLRAWVLLYGGTGSGKSTVGKVLNALLGDSTKNMSMGNYTGHNSHASAGLIGKQLLLDDDYPMGALLNDGFLKAISEEKQMDANPKGRDEFPFVARIVPLILSNNAPATRDVSGALYDRALVFPFNHMIPRDQRDPQLMAHMIRDELPGILARCVTAFGRLYARGDWQFPADCTAAWAHWIDQSNPLRLFVSDCLEEAEGAVMRASDVWEAYQLWYRLELGANGSARNSLGRTKFYTGMEQTLEQLRFHHREAGLAWRGWSVKPGILPDDDEDWDN